MSNAKKEILELKISLLSKGISFDMDIFKNVKKDFYDNRFIYGNTSAGSLPEHRFPQVLLLGEDIVTAMLRRDDSPWSLKIEGSDEQVMLYNNGKLVQEVGLPEKPPYFDKLLSDGSRADSIIAVAGEDTPGYFLLPDCHYFPDGVPCGFCSLKGTRKSVAKELETEFSTEKIAEATRLFQNTVWRDIPLVSITAGTAPTDEENRDAILRPIKAVYDAMDPKIPIHLLVHPPHDFDMLHEYYEAGVRSVGFNIEVYNPDLFAQICPGKNQYGYNKWMDSLSAATKVFGDYKAYMGLIWGLESVESTIEGHRFAVENKFGYASNIFHADKKSVLRNHPQPSESEIIEIIDDQISLYEKHPDAGTIFSCSQRSVTDWEVHRGDMK